MKQPSRMIFLFFFCLLSTVYCLLSTVFCLLATAYCLLSTVNCLLSSVYWLLPTFYCLLSTALLPSRKSDQDISKSDFLSDHMPTKHQTKSGLELAILRSKIRLFQKLNFDINKSTIILKTFHI